MLMKVLKDIKPNMLHLVIVKDTTWTTMRLFVQLSGLNQHEC